ncbi:MAG: hypothetical protein KDD14_17045 [Saprospiraceae bacterium]|nr:hypothetical protein [Saprospiraceae bacterium]
MKKLYAIIFWVLIFMPSCSSIIKRHNYILLIDNSKTINERTLDRYINTIEQTILPNLGRFDRLNIQFIDECSITLPERIFMLDLASMAFEKDADGLNHAADSTHTRMFRFLKDSMQANLRSTILAKRKERRECGNYTDIINALNEATSLITYEKSFESNDDKIVNDAKGKNNYEYENCIIIFSDMVNENREKTFDFTQFGKCNPKEIEVKMDELRKMKKIPGLSGCKILVFGATTTLQNGGHANKQIENCKLFWQSFFDEGGAELVGYAYDARKEIEEYMTIND